MAGTPTERDVGRVWKRLRRRKVVQWGVGYAAVAWAALQGIEYLGGTFDWPREIQRWATVALILALPIVVTLAWYHGDRGEQRVSRAEFAVLAALLLLGGGTLWWFAQREAPSTTATAERSSVGVSNAGPSVPAAVTAGPSIAVLPFENRSRLEDDAFFVDGIHDDILTQLSKVSALRVISRTSVERFRDTELSTKEIAGQLGVTSILEGGVQRAGDRVRINVQLIDGASDSHLWAETYDRELTAANIFAIQSEMATTIAGALRAALTPGEKARVTAVPTRNLAAWEAYQLGRQRLARRTAESIVESERFFRRAIELDRNFAMAHSGLADSLVIRLGYADVPRAATLDEAQAAADEALRLDPELADAWASAALIADSREAYDRAEQLYRRAVEINPSHPMALKWLGQLLMKLGRTDEGVRYLERAASLDPLSAIIQVTLGDALGWQGRYGDAAALYRRAIEIEPAMPLPYSNLAILACCALNDYVGAMPLAEKAVALDPDNPNTPTNTLARMYWDLGDDEALDRVLRKAEERWPDSAVVNVWLALRDLQRGDTSGAERHARLAHDANPRDGGGIIILGVVDSGRGRHAAAAERYRRAYPELFSRSAARIDPSNYFAALGLAPILQRLGDGERARALLEGSLAALDELPLLGIFGRAPDDAKALALLGRRQDALAALRDAQQAGWRTFWRYYRDREPAFDSIRDDPEFKAIFADIERDMARQRAALATRREGPPPAPGAGR